MPKYCYVYVLLSQVDRQFSVILPIKQYEELIERVADAENISK